MHPLKGAQLLSSATHLLSAGQAPVKSLKPDTPDCKLLVHSQGTLTQGSRTRHFLRTDCISQPCCLPRSSILRSAEWVHKDKRWKAQKMLLLTPNQDDSTWVIFSLGFVDFSKAGITGDV